MKKKIIATAMLLTTAMIWGFAFVAQVKGSAYVDTFTFNGVRFLLGGISLLPVVAIFEGKKLIKNKKVMKKSILSALLCGSILFLASTLQQYGAQVTKSAGISGFITGLYTVLTPIMCFFIFKKKVKINSWIGAVMAITGLFMLCVKVDVGLSFGIGEILLLISSVFWASHIIVVDLFVADISPLAFSMFQFLTCGFISMVSAFIFEDVNLTNIMNAKWPILYCGLLSVGVAYTLQILSQRRVSPTYAAIIFSTESVFSAVGGALFGNDKISSIGYCGCLVIFVGIVASQIDFEQLFKANAKTKIKEKNI